MLRYTKILIFMGIIFLASCQRDVPEPEVKVDIAPIQKSQDLDQ